MYLFGKEKGICLDSQIMHQNVYILKLFSKMLLIFKFNFNKIKLRVELDIFNVEFYIYFAF